MKWIAWKKLIAPKESGGMGLGSLRLFNLSLLAKWWWRLKSDCNGLWRKAILSIHSSHRCHSFIPFKSSITSPWKQIANLECDLAVFGFSLQSLFAATPGRNSSVRFWLDPWLTSSPLKSVFPKLFELERAKLSSITQRVASSHGMASNFSWNRPPSSMVEKEELVALSHLLSSFDFNQTTADKWRWLAGRTGVFSVKSLKSVAESSCIHFTNVLHAWNNWVPIKVNFFAWRIINNGVPTAATISSRGLVIHDLRCPFCHEMEESVIHLLGTCHFSNMVWDFIARWCRLPPIYFMEVTDLISLPSSFRGSKPWIKSVQVVFLSSLWALWRHRNEVVFEGSRPSADSVIGEIKSLGFLWLRNRSTFRDLSWENWISFTFAS